MREIDLAILLGLAFSAGWLSCGLIANRHYAKDLKKLRKELLGRID